VVGFGALMGVCYAGGDTLDIDQTWRGREARLARLNGVNYMAGNPFCGLQWRDNEETVYALKLGCHQHSSSAVG
jgi:hypothetical protein